MVNELVWCTGAMILSMETPKYVEKVSCPTAIYSPQIQQGVDRDRTRVSTVTALARLGHILFSFYPTKNPHWLFI
jgi:hypothetical protein